MAALGDTACGVSAFTLDREGGGSGVGILARFALYHYPALLVPFSAVIPESPSLSCCAVFNPGSLYSLS